MRVLWEFVFVSFVALKQPGSKADQGRSRENFPLPWVNSMDDLQVPRRLQTPARAMVHWCKLAPDAEV